MNDELRTYFAKTGIGLVVVAMVGGGASAAGINIPVLHGPRVPVMLLALGAVLLILGTDFLGSSYFLLKGHESSISVPKGSFRDGTAHYKTYRNTPRERLVNAAAFHRSDDGNQIFFTNRRGQIVQQVPSSYWPEVRRLNRKEARARTKIAEPART